MRKRMVWRIATLTVLLVVGVSYMAVWQYTELQQYKKDAADADKLLAEHNKRKQASGTIGSDVSDANDQPPPLGETDDTGYWEGNTWHQKTAPKLKKGWFWSGEMTLEEYFATGAGVSDSRLIIQNQPYSEAAIYARIQLAKRENFYNRAGEIEALKTALKYHPDSPALHVRIVDRMVSDIVSGEGSAEETVAFGEKALRLLKNSPENPDVYPEINLPREDAHHSLGIAYQYLGDYDTALYHLKQGQRLFKPSADEDPLINELRSIGYAKQIALIEAGNPMHKPRSKPTPQAFSLEGDIPSSPSADSSEQESMPTPFDLPSTVEMLRTSMPPDSVLNERERRAREVAEQAHAAFVQNVPDPQRQQQAFDDFLRRLQATENQKASQVADMFLIREMAKQLQGGKTEFTPQELIRAFSAVRQR